MNDQRMVDVELLRRLETVCTGFILVGKELRKSVDETEKTCSELRAIIDGPGVEPVGEIVRWNPVNGQITVQQEHKTNGYPRVQIGAPLYLAAPSAPEQHETVNMPSLRQRLTEDALRQRAIDAERAAPVQAVLDDWIDDAMALAHRWALACYYKGLNKPYEDIDCVRGELRALLAAAQQPPTVQAVPDWRPIETAPKDGTEIMAADSRVAGGFMQVVAYDALYSAPWRTQEDYGYSERAFTHWMPRPQPPKESTAQSVACPTDKEKS